jgi:hypothetical protein
LASLVHLFPDQASEQSACPRDGRVARRPKCVRRHDRRQLLRGTSPAVWALASNGYRAHARTVQGTPVAGVIGNQIKR